MVSLNNIAFHAFDKSIIAPNLSLKFNDGSINAIIGATGAGKTVLLGIIAGLIRDYDGEVLSGGIPVRSYSRKEKALRISYLFNHEFENREESLYNCLLLSRLPRKKFLRAFSREDHLAVEEYIAALELGPWKESKIGHLPRGLYRRAQLAFCLAREAGILLLDNPTAELDTRGRYLLMKALSRYTIDGGRLVVIASADLNFSLQIADRIAILSKGKLAREIVPEELTAELIYEYFDVEVLNFA